MSRRARTTHDAVDGGGDSGFIRAGSRDHPRPRRLLGADEREGQPHARRQARHQPPVRSALGARGYENSVASVVAKLLLREVTSPRTATGAVPSDNEDDEASTIRVSGYSARPGFTNANGQTVIRPTGLAGTDSGQSVYVLRCGHCSEEYGANESDIWLRKCPKCQGGRPGLAFGNAPTR